MVRVVRVGWRLVKGGQRGQRFGSARQKMMLGAYKPKVNPNKIYISSSFSLISLTVFTAQIIMNFLKFY